MTQVSNGRLKGIVELTGAGAILLGLIFVGLELKQNTAASTADTMQGLLETANQTNIEIAVNSEFAELVVRARKSLDGLTEGEHLRYLSYIHVDWNVWEHAFYSHSNGTMDDKLWRTWDISFYYLYCEKSSRLIWNELEPYFGLEFRAHLKEITDEDCASAGI
jgi:hypothetical protein